MFKRSTASGLALGAAAVLALSLTACSSSGSTAAGKTSSTGSAASTAGSATATSAAQSTSGSSASDSSSSASASDTAIAPPPTKPTPPAITNKKSDWVQRSGFKFKVDTVTYPYVPPAGAFLPPAPNEEYLKLHVELANIASGGAFSMMDLEVRDGTDTSILADVVATDDLPKDVRLNLLELKPGEKQTGELVFIAPKGAKGLRLIFKGTLMTVDGSTVDPAPQPVIDLGV